MSFILVNPLLNCLGLLSDQAKRDEILKVERGRKEEKRGRILKVLLWTEY